MGQAYTTEYFRRQQENSLLSAREIVPVLLELVHPNSVVDIGCGTGAWLSVFQEHGIKNVFGIDGPHIDRDMLTIDYNRFLNVDLSKAFDLGLKADLVTSLEVAEHLPPEAAETFIQCLVRIAPVVLFSAAIPGQGGMNHFNEQWPDYWAQLFKSNDYLVIDCLRGKIWRNKRIKFWFRQNILIFVAREFMESSASLTAYHEATERFPLSIVHPELLERNCARLSQEISSEGRTSC